MKSHINFLKKPNLSQSTKKMNEKRSNKLKVSSAVFLEKLIHFCRFKSEVLDNLLLK